MVAAPILLVCVFPFQFVLHLCHAVVGGLDLRLLHVNHLLRDLFAAPRVCSSFRRRGVVPRR